MNLNSANVATILIASLTVLVAVVGGINVIVNDLSFKEYAETLSVFAVGIGILGVGRGLAARKR